MRNLRTNRRDIVMGHRPLVMGILNVTPDSFSDGGRYSNLEAAVGRFRQMVDEGVDIVDIGGESTRPGSARVSVDEELGRVVPVVEALVRTADVPISVDTTKAAVVQAAVEAGAEIVNDISGLRFDGDVGRVAAETGAAVVLMHSRGDFETMHSMPPVDDVLGEVTGGLRTVLETALGCGIDSGSIVLDVGIGFGKTAEQNLMLIGELFRVCGEFPDYPMLVGASRKSFIGRLLGDVPPDQRDEASLAMHSVAAWNGAAIIRTHDIAAIRSQIPHITLPCGSRFGRRTPFHPKLKRDRRLASPIP